MMTNLCDLIKIHGKTTMYTTILTPAKDKHIEHFAFGKMKMHNFSSSSGNSGVFIHTYIRQTV